MCDYNLGGAGAGGGLSVLSLGSYLFLLF